MFSKLQHLMVTGKDDEGHGRAYFMPLTSREGGKPIKILREGSWPPHQKCNLEFPESEGV